MKMNRFPKSSKLYQQFLWLQLLLLGALITLLAAIFMQNLQPVIQVYFLGQITSPIPLSVAMFVALGFGCLVALIINKIADWRQDIYTRRTLLAFQDSKNKAATSNSTSNSNSDPKSYSQNTEQTSTSFEDEFYEEELYADEDEDYDDDMEEGFEDEIEDDDPDTIPYGDRFKSSFNNKATKPPERPPLDAKFIR